MSVEIEASKTRSEEDAVIQKQARDLAFGHSQNALLPQFEARIVREYGRDQLESAAVVLVGSLARPGSGALFVGLLEALSELRTAGALTLRIDTYAVLAIGATTANGVPVQEARFRAARALLDIQDFTHRDDPENGCASYVIGDELPSGNVLDTLSQINIAAATVLGITCDGEGPLLDEQARPFAQERRGRNIHWGQRGHVLNPDAPFAAAGAAFLYYPRQSLHHIAAAHFVVALCDTFAERDPDDQLEDRADTTPSFLKRALETTSESIRRRGIPLSKGLDLCSWEGAREAVRHVMDNRWNFIVSLYGRERFLRLPLEDWEQALDELEEFLERGVLSRRQRELDDVALRVLEAFEDGLADAFRVVGEQCWEKSVDFAPRRTCAKLLDEIQQKALAAEQQGQREWERTSHYDEPEIAHLKAENQGARSQLLNRLRLVPSPIAVALRTVPMLSVAVLLTLSVPLQLGPANSILVRSLVGLGLGGLCTFVFRRRALKARRMLLDALDAWVESHVRWQNAKDERLSFDATRKVLASVRDYCSWLLDSSAGNESFYPRGLTKLGRRDLGAGQAETESSARRHFLVSFSRDADHAKAAWSEIAKVWFAAEHDAQVLRIVPSTPPAFSQLFAIEADKPADLTLRTALEKLQRYIDGSNRDVSAYWLPFQSKRQPPRWALDLLVPTEKECGDDTQQRRAIRLFNLLVDVFEGSDQESLVSHVARHCGVDPTDLQAYSFPDTDLFTHLNHASAVPAPQEEDSPDTTLILCDEEHSLAQWFPGSRPISFAPNLFGVIRVRFDLSAEDIIFGGEKDAPRTHIGRAFNSAHRDEVPKADDAKN